MPPSQAEVFLSRSHAVPVLLALEKKALSAIQFTYAAEYENHDNARVLREEMEAWGLVRVEPATINGKAGHLVSLTSTGKKAADLLRRIGKPAHRERALRTIYALHEEGEMSTRRFCEVSRYTPPNAKLLREDLEALGLVKVAGVGIHGATHRVTLTAAGTRAARLVVELAALVDREAKA